MTKMIICSDVDFPSSVSTQAKELISQLLCKNRNARLGSGIGDYNDINREMHSRLIFFLNKSKKKLKCDMINFLLNFYEKFFDIQ